MVAKQNLEIYQGSDFQKVLEFKNESAVLMDLTGYTLRGQARATYGSSDIAFSFDFTLRDQTVSPGLVDMIVTSASTSLVSISKASEYIYDMELVDAFGIVRRFLEGKVKLFPEVTR